MKRRNAGNHAAVVGSLPRAAAAASVQRVRTGVTISGVPGAPEPCGR